MLEIWRAPRGLGLTVARIPRDDAPPVTGNRVVCALLVACLVSGSCPAGAQPSPRAPPTSAPDEATIRGRNAILRGQQLARDEQWGDALAAFEEAAAARDAPLVQWNIGYCERALGRYVAARRTLKGIAANPAGLDPSQVDDMKAYLGEFEKLIVLVTVQLDPPNATLTVDGRSLAEADAANTYLVGAAPAGAGASPGKPAFTVLLDPGAHVFRAVREGHQDVLLPKSYRAGENAKLDLHLDILPATIAIKSEPAAAIVRVDSREVGVAPIEFQRPAGQYKLEVLLDHYDTYKAALNLAPGERSDLTARLNLYTAPITKTWWFWTGAAVVVVGGVLGTYFLTRPAPQPPPYDAGSANWLVHTQQLQGFRW
jgi:hypothetical protein